MNTKSLVREMMMNSDIAAPCPVGWDEMTGDEKQRLCAQCNLHVLNVSEMTDEEVLVAMNRLRGGERVCMRIYRRADGTFLTKNCPVGLELLKERAHQAAEGAGVAMRQAAAWISGALAVILSCGAARADETCNSGGKQTWRSKITAAGATVKQGQPNSGSLSINSSKRRLEDRRVGVMVSWTEKDLDTLASRVKDFKSQGKGKPVEVADDMARLSGMVRFRWTIGQVQQLMEDALAIYEQAGEFDKAACVSAKLATWHMIRDRDVHNPALAAEYRAKADQYFIRGRSHVAADQQAITKLAGYDKNKNWKAASDLCWSIYSESSQKAGALRGEFWAARAGYYSDQPSYE